MRVPTDEELEAVQTALDEDGAQIVTIGSQLGKSAAQLVLTASKPIKKLQDRLLKDAAKKLVATDNGIDLVTTNLLNGANVWLQEAGFLLQNLGVKGGLIQPGDPITAALAQEVAAAPELQYMGTLVLAVKEAVPFLNQLIEVLREIRDRMPGSPVVYTGERPTKEKSEELVEFGEDAVGATLSVLDSEW